ncbi:esterase-like activity of phytase family protein [Acidovorax sp. GBBC 3334]|uniref:esterase-like activity of phytase family protein n=1 Tax=Acidovorax sp. GBBC 3334 TaxID=2940496 RepID=UPI0023046DAB|nr:esterase-like activity of phytase family protein [Acidovorax sp. GBBC 3334]MDA8454818.1 esterase-like activity of phytase family protein [Acidovorax sp. GBBC 3334]
MFRNLGAIGAFTLALLLPACGGSGGGTQDIQVRLIGEQRVANTLQVDGTLVGGLSGIDFDPRSNTWVLLSDDRSDKNPARFYVARLQYDLSSFAPVEFVRGTALRQADGSTYAGRATAAAGQTVPDPEAVRVDPRDGSLWWTSEGDRNLGLDPFVVHADAGGRAIAALPLPSAFKVSPTAQAGTRNNAAFEGLTLAADGETLWAGMEAPLYQDGPLPTPTAGATTRLLQYSRAEGVLRQLAYPLDPIQGTPAAGKNGDNGLSEMLAVDGDRFLVLERSGVQGSDDRYRMDIRLYEVDTRGASDVAGIASLASAPFTPVRKRLVAHLNRLGLPTVDNIEGMAWGPRLANGHRSLVLVSDNNFSDTQVTQFLAFEVVSE